MKLFTEDQIWFLKKMITVYVSGISVFFIIGCMCFLCGGCASINEAWMRGYVATHDAADAALSNKVGEVVNVPHTVNPEASTGCGCDLSSPTVWPLQFIGDKKTVDASIGAGDGCGDSGRRDCRAMLMRPDGNSWGYKYVFGAGCLEYSADFNQVKIKCFDFHGQRYHFVGWSTQESISTMTKANPLTWIDYKSGGHGMFLFFECR